MEKELWVKIKYGYSSKEISSFGRFRNRFTKQLMKSDIDRYGYARVSFYLNSRSKSFKVHRLVAEHFIPNPENKKQVNHKDSDKKIIEYQI